MNTSKSLKEILEYSIGHINEEGNFCATYKGKPCNCGIDEAAAAIVEAVEGIYGDSDGLREFAGLPSNQVVNPSPKQT